MLTLQVQAGEDGLEVVDQLTVPVLITILFKIKQDISLDLLELLLQIIQW